MDENSFQLLPRLSIVVKHRAVSKLYRREASRLEKLSRGFDGEESGYRSLAPNEDGIRGRGRLARGRWEPKHGHVVKSYAIEQ